VADRLGFDIAPRAHPASVEAPPGAGAGARLAGRFALLTAVFTLLWAAPVGLVLATVGPRPFADVAVFFTQAAFVTFGGAYAVLPFVAQGAVAPYGWLSRAEMVHASPGGNDAGAADPGHPVRRLLRRLERGIAGQAGGLTRWPPARARRSPPG
jgi:hypothetical protein